MHRYFSPVSGGGGTNKRKEPDAASAPTHSAANCQARGRTSSIGIVGEERTPPIPREQLLSALPAWLGERVEVKKDFGAAQAGGESARRNQTVGAGGFVMYWMRTALRAHENPALSAAVLAANALNVPLLVYLSLEPNTPHATLRRHVFILEGMRDACRELATSPRRWLDGVQVACRVPRRGDSLAPAHLTLAHRAALVVVEEPFVEPYLRGCRQLAAAHFPAAVWAVDAACVVPARLVNKSATLRAYAYAAATKGALVPLPFEPVDLDNVSIEDLAAACDVDHGVAPARHTAGGARAGYRRWRQFKDGGGLANYHKTRNDALRDGASRMSCYLNLGMVSPLRVAREAAAFKGGGKEKFIEELQTWREIAYAFVYHRPATYLSTECLPAWAQQTLAAHRGDQRAVFTDRALAEGRTGAAVWDAAQQALVETGEMHNNLRMSWGKAIVGWSASAEEAYDRLVYLNDRFALDGQAPPSYSGLLWCLGQFDSPKAEGAVLGTVRARPLSRCRYDPAALLAAARKRAGQRAGGGLLSFQGGGAGGGGGGAS